MSPARVTPALKLADEIEARAKEFANSPTVRDLLLHLPEFRPLMVATAIRAMSAGKFIFDKDEKRCVWFEDCATQMKAVTFLAAYTEGLPAQTSVQLNIGDQKRIQSGDEMTLEAALRSSPALADRLRAVLDGASGGGRKELKQAEKVT